jgi:hypothetical protein
MAATLLSDVIVPEVFTPNVIERTAELSAFLQSGVVSMAGGIPIGRGKTIELPFYQDLHGDDNVWVDTADISLNKINMEQDTAVVLTREKAWGASDLSAALMGDDPMDAIEQLVAGYWARRYQRTLIAILNGAVGAANMTGNVLDISGLSGGASDFDGTSFVDAQARLGDHQDSFVAVGVHSATYTSMKKNDLIEFVRDSQGAPTIPTYMGKRVIVDDGMPVSNGTYTTYLFAAGAVTMVEETVENADEVARHPEKNGGTDALYTRRKFVMHPRGIRWTPGSGVPALATPSNDELGASGNWTRVWEPKNIRVVQFKHTVA